MQYKKWYSGLVFLLQQNDEFLIFDLAQFILSEVLTATPL